jgi:putative ABC transport system permease protein
MLWVAALLAVIAAVLLASIPRLPSGGWLPWVRYYEQQPADHPQHRQAAASLRGHTDRCSFVLLAGASMLIKILLPLQAAETGFDTRQVLAVNVPVMSYGKSPDQIVGFYREAINHLFFFFARR